MSRHLHNSAPGVGQLPGPLAVRMFLCLAAAYWFSYSMRAINAVIAPDLVTDLSLTNAELGSLTSAYFFGFALSQLPLGVLLDRFGSRRVHGSLLLVAALGSFIFAVSNSGVGLWIGRALTGVGFAAGLMASLRLYRFWFAADRQQQLVSLMLVAGTSGALMATVPVRLLIPYVGWRGIFLGIGIALLVISVAVFTLLPRQEKLSPASGLGDGLRGYRVIYADPYIWRFLLMAIILQGGFVACSTLWAGPWFTRVLGMTPDASAQALFWFNLVLMCSFLMLSTLVRRFEQRGWTLLHITSVTSVGILLTHAALSVVGDPVIGVMLWMLWAMLAVAYTPIQTWVCMTFPDHLAGRALTAYNMVLFSGVFLIQWLFGVLVDWCISWSPTEADGFRQALRIWIGFEAVALIWMLGFRVRPYNERSTANEPGRETGKPRARE